MESKEILSSYGIPVTPSLLAQTADDAVRKAEEIGYPVVLKLHSEMISHKTEVDGVKLNLATDSEVRGAYQAIERSVIAKAGSNAFLGVTVQPMIRLQGYELILGSIVDQQFGPVILFGSGGQMVEIYRDRALALPPLNAALARRLVEQTKVYKALKGIRGRAPIDLAALDSLLVHFSQLIVDHPRIREIDINPLLASPGKLMALDARIVLFDGKVEEDALPRPAASAHPLF
jgi:acetyltransferase